MKRLSWSRLQISATVATLFSFLLVVARDEAAHAASKATLVIRAVPASTEILVAEPLVVTVTFEGVSALYVDDLSKDNDHLRVLIDRGTGYLPYEPLPFGSRWLESRKMPIKDGRGTFDYTLTYDKRRSDWTFGAPGTYRLVVEYRDNEVGTVRSNVVAVTATAPSGDDKAVHDALRRLDPSLLAVPDPVPLDARIATLVEEYPSSVYLQRARVNDLLYRLLQANEADLRAGVPLETHKAREDVRRKKRLELLSLARELSEIPSQFRPDALKFFADLQGDAGDLDGRKETLKTLGRDFASRPAGRAALADLAELEKRGNATPHK